jgi:hypothetical protein
VPINGRPGLDQVSWVVPARWGFAMVASSADLRTIETIKVPEFCNQVSTLPPGTQLNPDGSLPQGLVLPDGTSVPAGTVLPPGVNQQEVERLCHPDLPKSDPLWNHSKATWTRDLIVLIVLGAAGIMLVTLLLRRLEPKRRANAPVAAGPPARVG